MFIIPNTFVYLFQYSQLTQSPVRARFSAKRHKTRFNIALPPFKGLLSSVKDIFGVVLSHERMVSHDPRLFDLETRVAKHPPLSDPLNGAPKRPTPKENS
jgi:hypothetical protein